MKRKKRNADLNNLPPTTVVVVEAFVRNRETHRFIKHRTEVPNRRTRGTYASDPGTNIASDRAKRGSQLS